MNLCRVYDRSSIQKKELLVQYLPFPFRHSLLSRILTKLIDFFNKTQLKMNELSAGFISIDTKNGG